MAFTGTEDLEEEQEEQAPADSSNRNFWIIFGVLGGILLLALICMAVYAVFILPGRHEDTRNQNATAAAQNTEMALSSIQTEASSRVTPTPIPTDVPLPSPTITPLMGGKEITATATSVEGVVETRVRMMTEAAQTDQAVQAALATTQAASTALPDTGFADEVGIPGLLALAAIFVVVIFLVRRLRTVRA